MRQTAGSDRFFVQAGKFDEPPIPIYWWNSGLNSVGIIFDKAVKILGPPTRFAFQVRKQRGPSWWVNHINFAPSITQITPRCVQLTWTAWTFVVGGPFIIGYNPFPPTTPNVLASVNDTLVGSFLKVGENPQP